MRARGLAWRCGLSRGRRLLGLHQALSWQMPHGSQSGRAHQPCGCPGPSCLTYKRPEVGPVKPRWESAAVRSFGFRAGPMSLLTRALSLRFCSAVAILKFLIVF